MKSVIRYISYLGLMLGMTLLASFAQAQVEALCQDETDPYYIKINAFDGTDETRKDLIKEYHGRREAVYAVCEGAVIRKFESSYREKIGKENESEFEKMSFFPKPRKPLDLGEVGKVKKRQPANQAEE